MRYAVALLACGLLLLAGSCQLFDPPMCEVGMHVTKDGRDCVCLVQAWNERGRQTQELSTNELGVVYIKRLVAGSWTFKFVGHDGRTYPAVRTIQLAAGATSTITVDVNQEKDPEAEAKASQSVVTYGEDDISP